MSINLSLLKYHSPDPTSPACSHLVPKRVCFGVNDAFFSVFLRFPMFLIFSVGMVTSPKADCILIYDEVFSKTTPVTTSPEFKVIEIVSCSRSSFLMVILPVIVLLMVIVVSVSDTTVPVILSPDLSFSVFSCPKLTELTRTKKRRTVVMILFI
jgi:hypothetical protein